MPGSASSYGPERRLPGGWPGAILAPSISAARCRRASRQDAGAPKLAIFSQTLSAVGWGAKAQNEGPSRCKGRSLRRPLRGCEGIELSDTAGAPSRRSSPAEGPRRERAIERRVRASSTLSGRHVGCDWACDRRESSRRARVACPARFETILVGDG